MTGIRRLHRRRPARPRERRSGVLALLGLVAPLLAAGDAAAQRLPFRTYSSDDGLAQSVVLALLEERDGYLWLGTAAGLSRFDGLVFTSFTEGDGLADDTVRALLAGRGGELWVGTDSGLTRRTDDGGWESVEIGAERLSVRALAETADGTLWAGTYGDGLLALEGGAVRRLGRDAGLPDPRVRTLLVDRRGRLWVGTYGGGLARGDGERFVALGAAAGIENPFVRCLLEDRAGRLLAGTNDGVFVADAGGDRFARFLPGAASLRTAVTALLEDRRGRLWIGTRDEGVCRLDGDALECFRVEQGLADESVNALLEDREGNVWLGTFGGGVSRLSSEGFFNYTAADGLPASNVDALSEAADGTLWLATHGGGVAHLVDGRFVTFDSRDGLPHDKIISALADGGETPWFGTLAGAVRVGPEGPLELLSTRHGLPSDTVLDLARDGRGRLWLATLAGAVVREADGTLTTYDAADGLPDDRVNVLEPAADGGMWIGTAAGVARFDGAGFTAWTRADGLVDGYVTDVLESGGDVWISTGRGLSRLRDGRFTSWTTDDGLSHDNCVALVEDTSGRLWVGTSSGIDVFDGETFTVFDRRDGLVSGEVNLNAALRDRRGDLWFGTVGGAVVFRAVLPEETLPPPPVHVTRVEVGQRPVEIDGTLDLDHTENDLHFEYVGVSLGHASDVVYDVRLAGHDDRWRRTAARVVDFPAVPPGDYTFEVRARVRDSGWSADAARVAFSIAPPFWRDPRYVVPAIVVGLVLAGAAHRERVRTVERRNAELEKTVREREKAEAEVRRYARELEHANLHDRLTGLPNRALLRDRVEVALAQSRRHAERGFAVLTVDLDRFQLVIDSHGHAFGDALLVECGRRLAQRFSRSDTVARLGGDVFALLATDAGDATEASRLAEGVQELLGRPFEIDGHRVVLTAGIGVVVGGASYASVDELLRDADTAMHRAKAEGRGRTALFDPDMHALAVERLRLEGDLRGALERGEFRLRYQPIRSLATGDVDGFEALLRWRHPHRGLLTPVAFLAQAEETGLGLDLDDWVLGEACRRAAGWARRHPERALAVSVNLSHRQLIEPGLAQRLAHHLEASGLPSRLLRIEITEEVLIEDPESAVRALADVKALDVEVHLDDFGTGFSSLSYLQRFPVDVLKIDRSFVRRLTETDGSAKIVESILHLARNLGIRVVAEGVETAEQLARLEDLGCDYAQGFHVAAPLTGDEVDRFLAARPVAPLAPLPDTGLVAPS